MKIQRKYMAHYLNAGFAAEEAAYVRLGRDLEPYVAERFTEASALQVRRVNAILRNLIREKDTLPPVTDLSIQYSHPQWLVDTYITLLGREEAERTLERSNIALIRLAFDF